MLRHARICQGFGWGVLTFMSTCRTRTCYFTPGFGVRGVLTFMSTCRTRTCYVIWGGGCYRSCQLAAHAHATSRQGLGWGGVDVHVNLPPTHMLRHARVVGGGECASVHVSLPPKYLYFCLSDVNVLYDLYIYYTYIYICIHIVTYLIISYFKC